MVGRPPIRIALLSLLGLCVVARSARGAEVHTLFDGACRRTSGVLVHVDADAVSLVTLAGDLVVEPRERIAAIAVHKTLENPLTVIRLSDALREHLRDVWVGDDARPTFTGWTTAFFDDLFLYFDLEGQTHVLDPEDIARIRPSAIQAREVRPRTHASVVLAFPAQVVPCGSGDAVAGSLFPSRVIADRIKVGDYLTKLEQNYLAQAGFEERTRVYAEPFLFDIKSRLGLIYDQESVFAFPFYFRWSNGRPYRFQSLSVVGNSSHEWLPITGPTMSLRSDIKSHFFSGTFVGNVFALPAGTDAFLLDEPAELETGDAPEIDRSYNYMLLMGGDFWRLSGAVGASYLAARVNLPGNQPRVLLASELSPTVRLRFHGPTIGLRALYYRTRTDGLVTDLVPDDFGDISGFDERYRWRLDTVRVGATWKPLPSVEIMVDQLGSRGDYRDDGLGADMGGPEPIGVGFWELTTAGELAVTFGRYVTVRGTARLHARRTRVRRPFAQTDTTYQPHFGGTLEFVF